MQVDAVAGSEVADCVRRTSKSDENEGVVAGAAVKLVSASSGDKRIISATALNGVAEIIGYDYVISVAGPRRFDERVACDLQGTSSDRAGSAGMKINRRIR